MATVWDPGTYRAAAREGALGETKAGKEQVAVRFELLDHENASITWYGHFTDKTLETTFKALRTAGWRGQDLSDLSDLARPDVPEVWLVLENETDDAGTVRTKVRWVNGAGGLALGKALDANKAKTFAARMRAQVAAFDAKNPGAKAQPKPAHPNVTNAWKTLGADEASPFNDDPIPF